MKWLIDRISRFIFFRFVSSGLVFGLKADVMIAGGSEAAMTPLCFAGFCSMRAMVTSFNDNPEQASRPFDKDRAGFVMGEGAGVIIMETEEHALARGATIYCEVPTAIAAVPLI